MAKRFQFNPKLLLQHLATGAFCFNQHLTYSRLLSLTELAFVINRPLATLMQNQLVAKHQLTATAPLPEPILQEFCLEAALDFTAQPVVNPIAIAQNFFQPVHSHQLQRRIPVITIMGHVDHGKTTLLDTLRRSHLASLEAGQITQQMGAYQVVWAKQPLTFIDTPGHELFSQMRLRGAQVTDLVVLVIAANAGVQAQTLEALQQAQAQQVPIIVFLNKIDLPHSQVEAIKQQLTAHQLTPTDWGGQTTYVSGSALQLATLTELLNAIVKQTSQLPLTACLNCWGQAIVLESRLTRSGVQQDVIVRCGALRPGQYVIVNANQGGKLRSIVSDRVQALVNLLPGQTGGLLGLTTNLPASTQLFAFPSAELAEAAQTALQTWQSTPVRNPVPTVQPFQLDERFWTTPSANQPAIQFVLIKVATKGMEDVVRTALAELFTATTNVKVVSLATGPFNQHDYQLAVASQAKVFLLGTTITKRLQIELNQANLALHQFQLLHELLTKLTTLIPTDAASESTLVEVGQAEVIRVFVHSKLGTIAGCAVKSGQIKWQPDLIIKQYRANQLVTSKLVIKSMERANQTVKQASANQEIGLIFAKYHNLKIGDQLTQYQTSAGNVKP